MGGHTDGSHRYTAAAAQIPSFPASTPKLLSQRVYSALLALDVSAPCEPVGGGGGVVRGAGGVAEGQRQDVREKKEGEERRGGSGVIRERRQISKKEMQLVIKYVVTLPVKSLDSPSSHLPLWYQFTITRHDK